MRGSGVVNELENFLFLNVGLVGGFTSRICYVSRALLLFLGHHSMKVIVPDFNNIFITLSADNSKLI